MMREAYQLETIVVGIPSSVQSCLTGQTQWLCGIVPD